MKKLLFFLATALAAQTPTFTVAKQTSLSGAAEVITVQQPANGAFKRVVFVSGYVDCSVACVVTVERNGTAATSTLVTPGQVNPQLSVGATAQGFSSSNVGVGTVLSKISLAASGQTVFDLSDFVLTGRDNTQNVTIRTSSITGTVDIVIKWREL